MEGTEGRSRELNDISREETDSKINRAPEICVIITKELTFVLLESWKGIGLKIWRNDGWKLSTFGNRPKPVGWRIPKRVNPKISIPKHNIIKLLRSNDKERNLESREGTPYLQGMNDTNNSGLLTRKDGAQRKWHDITQVLKANNCQPEFCMYWT